MTIRRDGRITHVECRIRDAVQDVTWIEQLIGRRISLGADAIIAVSSSGFTAGALAKAKSYGVVTRDLQQLTEAEIQAWGRTIELELSYYQYSNLTLMVAFKGTSPPAVDGIVEQKLTFPDRHKNLLSRFGLKLELPGLHVSGIPVVAVELTGSAKFFNQQVTSPVVRAYGDPSIEEREPDITIETFDSGETSIVQTDDAVSLVIDLSAVQIPPLCQFRFARTVSASERELLFERLELLGIEHLPPRGPIKLDMRLSV